MTCTRCCSTRRARSRSAIARRPSSSRCPGVTDAELADAAQLASLPDETPEGRSIVVLAKQRYQLRGRDLSGHGATFVPFYGADADVRRRSGRPRDPQGRRRTRSSGTSTASGGNAPAELTPIVERIASSAGRRSSSPSGSARSVSIHLKDIVKGGMRERFSQLRGIGIRDGHDHRRQPADGRGDRRRSGGRRLPGRRRRRKTRWRSSSASRRTASSSR